MGRKKKVPAEDGDDARFNATLKLRSSFLEKLRLVAEDLDLFPGALVEQHMGDWVEIQYLRVLRKKLAAAEKGSKDRPPGG